MLTYMIQQVVDYECNNGCTFQEHHNTGLILNKLEKKDQSRH